MEFAEALKAARKTAGLSQRAMSERMGIPTRTIEMWEVNERTPPPYVQRMVLRELAELSIKENTPGV